MLPPLGETTGREHEVLEHLNGLAAESNDERSQYDEVVQSNQNLYVFGDDNPPHPDDIVIPSIQDTTIAITDIQTRQPPSASLEPVETGEPATWWWAGPPVVAQWLGVPPECAGQFLDPMTGELSDAIPLDPLEGERLKATAFPPEIMPVLQAGTCRPEHVVEQDDRLVADVYQSVFDVLWARSEIDPVIRDNLLNTNISGTTFGLYEFDDDEKLHCIREIPFTQMYIDPTARTLKQAAYVGFDLPMDAEEAKSYYPGLEADIDANAQEGEPNRPSSETTLGYQYERRFRRKMVTLRVFWVRYELLPLSEDEAIESGQVVQQEVVDEPSSYVQPVQTPGNIDEGVASGFGQEVDGGMDDLGPEEPVGVDSIGDGDVSTGAAVPTAALLSGGLGQLVQSRTVLLLVDSRTEVTPGTPGWPKRRGIRQIISLAEKIVDDRPCEFADFPILHNVNIPLPGSRPYGIGEPQRLRCLQRAKNRTVNGLVEHVDRLGHPIITRSQSMDKRLPKEARGAGSVCGMEIIVPDNLWQQSGGKVMVVQEAPALPVGALQLVPMLDEMIDKSSGYTPPLRGQSLAGDSGKKVELLQSSAAAVMGFKAQRTGDMVYRLARLMLHSIVWRMEVEDIFKIVSKYPMHVLRAIHERARQIEWNVVIKIQAGAEGMKQQKIALAQTLLSLGLLSPQTASEWANIDYRVERQRILSHQQWMAGQMGVQPEQQGKQGGDEQQQPEAV